MFALTDALRRAQGEALGALGLGPNEHPYAVVASGMRWRLRRYRSTGCGPPVLIVAAPIKRPYIWDLGRASSVVRYCARCGLALYLLEWLPPANGGAGLDEYVGNAVGAAVAGVVADAGGRTPMLMGHSLGGTFAAMYAALAPERVAGLVLVSAPLCFHPGVSRFRDALVRTAPSTFSTAGILPGSVLSQVSALAAPETFVWSRLVDAALSIADPSALDIHARVERWALDEVPLPGVLVGQILAWLYRGDRFYRGTLLIRGCALSPTRIRCPVLAIVNSADDIAPPDSIVPFLDAAPVRDKRLLAAAREAGVGMQHFALLVGRCALARVWPQILAWIEERS